MKILILPIEVFVITHIFKIVEPIAINFNWIFSVASVMATGGIDKGGRLELRRLTMLLNKLHCDIKAAEVKEISRRLRCIAEDSPACPIYYYEFLYPIKSILSTPETHKIEENEEKKQSPKEKPLNPDEKVPGDEEEKKIGEEEDKDKEQKTPNEKSPMSDNLQEEEPLPELDPNWNQGDFVLNINRCHECHNHESSSRHSEEVK